MAAKNDVAIFILFTAFPAQITSSALFDKSAPENIPARKYSLKTRRRGIVSEENHL